MNRKLVSWHVWRSSTIWYTVNSSWKHSVFAYRKRECYYISRLLSCSSVCHQLDSWSVFAYPKQRATVLVGSVLKWRARPQCLHRQLKCLRVSKTESYGLSRICFEMTRQATMPSSKAWLCLADEQHICFEIARQFRLSTELYWQCDLKSAISKQNLLKQ
jgi:hypothetical protein